MRVFIAYRVFFNPGREMYTPSCFRILDSANSSIDLKLKEAPGAYTSCFNTFTKKDKKYLVVTS